jgi:hypothetical protein
MRADDLSGGSLKALLIFLLLAANIAVAALNKNAPPPTRGSARELRAIVSRSGR